MAYDKVLLLCDVQLVNTAGSKCWSCARSSTCSSAFSTTEARFISSVVRSLAEAAAAFSMLAQRHCKTSFALRFVNLAF